MWKMRPSSSYHAEWVRGEEKRLRCRHTVLLHDTEELDDDLGRRVDEDLSLSRLLGVVDGVEGIVEDGGLDHDCGWRFSNRKIGSEVSADSRRLAFMGSKHGECPHDRQEGSAAQSG